MLTHAKRREVAAVPLGLGPDCVQTLADVLSECGQSTLRTGVVKEVNQPFSVAVCNEVTRTVPAVMAYVKRFVAPRSLGLRLEVGWIGVIDPVASCFLTVP